MQALDEATDTMISWTVHSVVQGLSSVDEFLEKLPDFDGEIESQRKDAEASGEVSLMNPWNDDSISLGLPKWLGQDGHSI